MLRVRRWLGDATRAGIRMHDDRRHEFFLKPRFEDIRGRLREAPRDVPDDDASVESTVPSSALEHPTVRQRLKAIASLCWVVALLAVYLVMMGFFILMMSRHVARWLHTSVAVAVPITLGSGALGIFLLTRITKPHHTRRLGLATVSELLRLDLCPCCGYSLLEVPSDPDSCKRCPECGAAWNAGKWAADFPRLSAPADEPPLKRLASRFNILDARSRPVPMLAERPEDRAAILHSHAIPLSTEVRIGDGVRILLVLAPLGVCLLALGPSPRIAGLIAVLVVEALVVPAVLITAVSARNEMARRRFVRFSVDSGRCPCCEGALRPTPSAVDSALICTVCGSAWLPEKPP